MGGGYNHLVEKMKIYLVNPSSRRYVIEDNAAIKNYIKNENISRRGASPQKLPPVPKEDSLGGQGLTIIPNGQDKPVYDINILESYYYARNNKVITELLPYFGNFLLDSGAFTFMANSGNATIDWDTYIEDYAAYINQNKISQFFELDIDSIVGLTEIERLRAKLENLTKIQPIPVWHLSRGKAYFEKMCEKYPYVAIGGIVTQEIPRDKYESYFHWFINTAHRYKAKIHGLGYTGNLRKYRFDSVDSTAWLYGNRGGYLYIFDEKSGKMNKIEAPEGKRLKSSDSALHNFNQWLRYCRWADRNL